MTIGSSSLAQDPGNLLYLQLPMPSGATVTIAPGNSSSRLPHRRRPATDEARTRSRRQHRRSRVTCGIAFASSDADPGVTPTSILIGGTVPLSGEAAAFGSVGPGAKAYFDYVNAHGGVYGRKIEYRYYDDGYDPSRTVQLTRQLVDQDKVFAIFNSIGTANNIAIRDYLNAVKVPQLFAGDGSRCDRRLAAQVPVDDRLPPELPWRGRRLRARPRRSASPKAKIAVLFENTDLGKDMTRGLSRAIAGKGPKIVASQSYEYTATDVSSQIAQLKASGANTLMLFATPKFMIQGVVATHKLGWKPQLYVASLSIEPTIMGIASVNAPELTKGALSDRVREEPERPDLGEGQGARAVSPGDEALRPVRQAERRLQLVRHDGRLDDGRNAQGGGQEPDAREPAARSDASRLCAATPSCCRGS